MEVADEIEIKDDEIKLMFKKISKDLKFTTLQNENKLRQHATTLTTDVSRYIFDFTSDSVKYDFYGRKLVEIMLLENHDVIKHVDLYYIHEKLISSNEKSEKEAFDKTFNIANDNDKTFDNNIYEDTILPLEKEFLASKYLMKNLTTISSLDSEFDFIISRIFTNLEFKNIRNFMDSYLKHNIEYKNEFSGFSQRVERLKMILHRSIEENSIFLVDFLITHVLKTCDETTLKKILATKNIDGNNIFHLACELRIKFLIEELWNLIQKAFSNDTREIEKYLLHTNENGKNAFQLSFQMPLKYRNNDYANEIKNCNALLYYYRDPGLLELELYNFESALNIVHDIARKNISDRIKRNLILAKDTKKMKSYDKYEYSSDFCEFRYDFLQLRFSFITKISSIKTESLTHLSRVYNFLSNYVDQYLYSKCNDEDELMKLYEKLSFDFYLSDFFKIFSTQNFCFILDKIKTPDILQKFLDITKKILPQKDLHEMLSKAGHFGNNALQIGIETGNLEMFRLIWRKFEFNQKSVVNWILHKNIDGNNAIYMLIHNHQIDMLNIVLEYFSDFDEDQLMFIFENTGKSNYKIIDVLILMYEQQTYNKVMTFIRTFFSIENQKKLFSGQSLLYSASKWQESTLINLLNFIECTFDEDGIKEILFYTSWEKHTIFHVASKNSNLSFLQLLCKFARFYLSDDDFLKIITQKDKNEWKIVYENASSNDILNNLPVLSNFYTDRAVYEWVPVSLLEDEIQIPCNAVHINNNESNCFYVAKCYNLNEQQNFSIISFSTHTKIEDGKCVDILAGRGLFWMNKSDKHSSDREHSTGLKIEGTTAPLYIKRNFINQIQLVSTTTDKDEILSINNNCVYEMEDENCTFKRSN